MRARDRVGIVVVGGGVIGCAIAYHLVSAGVRDVLVVERNQLATGATARSAGCVSHARSDSDMLRMIVRTRADIRELEEQLGEPLDFRQSGCIRAVFGEASERELRRAEACMAAEGQAVQAIDAADARALSPWLDLRAARRIVYIGSDGYVDGARLAQAYARVARMRGARIRRGVDVSSVLHENGEVRGVATNDGVILARTVVDAAGPWSAQIAASLHFGYPAVPTRTHYWITARDGAVPSEQPNVQLPDTGAYFRAEVGGLVVGVREAASRTYDALALERDMACMPLDEGEQDMDLLIAHAAALRDTIPNIDQWLFAHHVTGLSMYTPDGRFVIGDIGVVRGFIVAGGCCGSGVAAAGGIGTAVADLITGHAPSIDMSRFRPDRFGTIDPRSAAFHESCSAARLGKARGQVIRAIPPSAV